MNPPTQDELEFISCNFSHPQPAERQGQKVPVRLWPGDSRPRVFRNCNLVNAQGPAGSVYINCNTAIRAIATRTEPVTSGGRPDGEDEVETVTVYGRLLPTGQVQYKQTPEVREARREILRPEDEGIPRETRERFRQEGRQQGGG